MNAGKLFVLIRRIGLPVLVVMTLGSLALAVVQAWQAAGQTSLGQALYATLTSDAQQATGWAKVMHILFTTLLGWAAVRVYMATAGIRWDAFSARRLARRHVVILAGRSTRMSPGHESPASPESVAKPLSDKTALACDLALSLAPMNTVVINLPQADQASLDRLWAAGITVLNDDLGIPQALEAAGASRAGLLIAMRDRYDENIVLTRAALSPTLNNPGLQCKCMIEPLRVRQSFRLEDYLERISLARVRVFNEAELVARRIVRDHPPEASVATTPRGVHVLLVGMGSVGQSVLLQLARLGHYRSELKTKVTLVDQQVKARWRDARAAYPALADWLQVETEETRFENLGQEQFTRWLQDERPITMVYVCTKNEIANLRISRLLLERMRLREAHGGPPAARVVALDPSGGSVLEEFATYGDHGGLFHVFSLTRASGTAASSPVSGSLLTDTDDAWAKCLHEDYCAGDDQACAQDPSRQKAVANQPWDVLEETYREANRGSADHLEVKLRAVARILAAHGEAEPSPLDAEEIELLARMEHNRWWAERALNGWSYASRRDDLLKHHPNMLPYEQLDEPTRQKDRDSVINMMRIVCGTDQVLARS